MKYTEVRQISRKQYNTLLDLKRFANEYIKVIHGLKIAGAGILGYQSDETGWWGDCIWGEISIDELLEIEEIEVKYD